MARAVPFGGSMTTFGYHASHEQYAPSELLAHVRHAESAGFIGCMASDHFHPWTTAQGQSGFTWSWLGAAFQATSISFGTVNAPGERYHPAIIAQAAATLAEMFPERFWLTIGSGEALNEGITGGEWPGKALRNERLRECAEVMKALWAGETVTHDGLITVRDAKLYSRPAKPPLLFGAALTVETAEFVGGWADGLVTLGGDSEEVAERVAAFCRGGGDGKPVRLQHTVSWAKSDAEALRGAHEQWAFSAIEQSLLAELRTPAEFEAATRDISPTDVAKGVRVSSDLERHTAWLQEYVDLDIDAVYILNVNRGQEAYINAFGEHVLPDLQDVNKVV